MLAEWIVRSLRENDDMVLQYACSAPDGIVAEIERALPQFDEEATELTALFLHRYNGAGAGRLLLKLTGDVSLQVATAAACYLSEAADLPSGQAILAAIPDRDDSFVRGQMFLAAGRAQTHLEALRAAARAEDDPDAILDAEAAATKLGGRPEGAAFRNRVRQADAGQALRLCGLLEYIGDAKLAKALLPWLSSRAGVIEVDYGEQEVIARMCDLAAYTAGRLGVRFPLPPDGLCVYADGIIAGARAAIMELPELG